MFLDLWPRVYQYSSFFHFYHIYALLVEKKRIVVLANSELQIVDNLCCRLVGNIETELEAG